MRRVVSVLALSVSFVLLLYLHPVWERMQGVWMFFFYCATAFLFVCMVVLTMREISRIVRLVRRRRTPASSHYIPVVILELFLFFGLVNPFTIDLEQVYGKVVFRACHKGMQSQATITLHENNYFEIRWTGALYDEYFTGRYHLNGDTLFLDYNGRRPIRFGSKILMDDFRRLLITIREEHDGLQNIVLFYYGYCKEDKLKY